MTSWEGVIEFVAVAELSSFTGAAGKLSTSVAQVSRRVATLEHRLGTSLLHRTTRKVTLSEAGKVYYQHCKHLVDGLRMAELAVNQLQSVPSGLIRITAPVTFGENLIAPRLHRFLQQYPKVSIECLYTNETLDVLEHGIDLAIRIGQLPDSTLIARRLGYRQNFVCASPAYLANFGEPQELSELSHHACLVGNLDSWRFTEQGKERSLRVQGPLKCNSGKAILDAAIRGLGLAQLPDYYVNSAMASGELVEVLSAFRCQQEGIWALHPPGKNLLQKVKLLIEYLDGNLHR